MKREYLIDVVWQGDTEFVDAHALTVAIKRLGIAYVIPKYQFKKMSRESIVERIRKE